MAVTVALNTGWNVQLTGAPDLGSALYTYAQAWTHTLGDGSGLNQVNKFFQDSVTLAGSGTVSYDLDAATMLNPFGATITFSRIALIAIRRTDTPAASTQDENVTIGGDFVLTKVLAGWVDDAVTIPIRPGGTFIYVSPDATGTAVTATTGDVITLTNSSSADSCTLNVLIIGS